MRVMVVKPVGTWSLLAGPEEEDAVAAIAAEQLLVSEWLQEDDQLAYGRPTKTVHRGEAEAPNVGHVRLRRELRHVVDVWHYRAYGGTDEHRCASVRLVRQRLREHEDCRRIFAQFRVSSDNCHHGGVDHGG